MEVLEKLKQRANHSRFLALELCDRSRKIIAMGRYLVQKCEADRIASNRNQLEAIGYAHLAAKQVAENHLQNGYPAYECLRHSGEFLIRESVVWRKGI